MKDGVQFILNGVLRKRKMIKISDRNGIFLTEVDAATLRDAYLRGANLSGADLSDADLGGVEFNMWASIN